MPRFITIKKNVDRLASELAPYYRIYTGMAFPDTAYERFVGKLSEVFKTDYRVMAMSCNRVKGAEFTEDIAYDLLWRLVANKNILKDARPVLYYDRVSFSGIEEVQFVSVKLSGERYKTKIRVLTGHYAPNIFKRDFSFKGISNVLRTCGFHGRKYIPGRVEESLPGLFAKAELLEYQEDPRVLKELISSADIESFNRKNVIGPRMGYVRCPLLADIGFRRCLNCSVCRKNCFASYKED